MAVTLTSQLANKRLMTQDGNADTVEGAVQRAGGRHLDSTVTLDANNTSANVNAFQITGSIHVISLHAEILTAGTLTNCTAVSFDLWDGALSTALTKASPGAVLSGEAVGTIMTKIDINTANLSILSNATGAIEETTGNKVAQAFDIIQKSGQDTFIRFNYTTTDTPIDATVEVHMEYFIRDGGTVTVV